MRAFDPVLQPVEQRFAHAIGSRAYVEFRETKSLAAPRPAMMRSWRCCRPGPDAVALMGDKPTAA
jgi:hypothetical protein